MKVGELMSTKVVTLNEEDSIEDAFDLMIGEHIHGAPVIGADGQLVGVVSQLDIYFGKMTLERRKSKQTSGEGDDALTVKDVMTSPAVSAAEDTDIVDICRMMYKLARRVPGDCRRPFRIVRLKRGCDADHRIGPDRR
jgi:CBS domain-containing protein